MNLLKKVQEFSTALEASFRPGIDFMILKKYIFYMIIIKIPCRILPKSTGLEITSRICKVYLNLIYRFCHNTKLFQLNIIYIIDDLIITYGR